MPTCQHCLQESNRRTGLHHRQRSSSFRPGQVPMVCPVWFLLVAETEALRLVLFLWVAEVSVVPAVLGLDLVYFQEISTTSISMIAANWSIEREAFPCFGMCLLYPEPKAFSCPSMTQLLQNLDPNPTISAGSFWWNPVTPRCQSPLVSSWSQGNNPGGEWRWAVGRWAARSWETRSSGAADPAWCGCWAAWPPSPDESPWAETCPAVLPRRLTGRLSVPFSGTKHSKLWRARAGLVEKSTSRVMKIHALLRVLSCRQGLNSTHLSRHARSYLMNKCAVAFHAEVNP